VALGIQGNGSNVKVKKSGKAGKGGRKDLYPWQYIKIPRVKSFKGSTPINYRILTKNLGDLSGKEIKPLRKKGGGILMEST